MANLNFRVEDDLREELEAEAEQHGYGTLSAYVRFILQNRHETTGGNEEFEERLSQLEERIEELERTQTNTTQINTRQFRETEEHEPEPDPPREMETATPSSTPEPQGNGGETTIEDVVENWQPGRGVNERQPRREAGRAALEWLRENGGPASAAIFKRELHDDYPVNDQNEDTWWKKSARPALQEAEDAGLVEYRPGHHDYVWID